MSIKLIGRQFTDVLAYLPCVKDPVLRDSHGSEERIKNDAHKLLLAMPRTAFTPDGEEILIHNLQQGSLKERAIHLVTNDRWKTIDRKKVRTVHLVQHTLEQAAFRLIDRKEGTVLYVARYTPELIHCVVVKIKKHPPSPEGITGYLITQFPYETGGRQDYFQVGWA